MKKYLILLFLLVFLLPTNETRARSIPTDSVTSWVFGHRRQAEELQKQIPKASSGFVFVRPDNVVDSEWVAIDSRQVRDKPSNWFQRLWRGDDVKIEVEGESSYKWADRRDLEQAWTKMKRGEYDRAYMEYKQNQVILLDFLFYFCINNWVFFSVWHFNFYLLIYEII